MANDDVKVTATDLLKTSDALSRMQSVTVHVITHVFLGQTEIPGATLSYH